MESTDKLMAQLKKIRHKIMDAIDHGRPDIAADLFAWQMEIEKEIIERGCHYEP